MTGIIECNQLSVEYPVHLHVIQHQAIQTVCTKCGIISALIFIPILCASFFPEPEWACDDDEMVGTFDSSGAFMSMKVCMVYSTMLIPSVMCRY